MADCAAFYAWQDQALCGAVHGRARPCAALCTAGPGPVRRSVRQDQALCGAVHSRTAHSAPSASYDGTLCGALHAVLCMLQRTQV
eukprot:352630-Chlamydomonas_euryale.AAC.12